MNLLRREFLLFGFLLSAFSAPAVAQPAALDLQLARDPASVTTAASREFSGLLDGWRDGRVHLRVATGGGEVGYSFAPEEIARLRMPGADLEAQAADLWDRGLSDAALPFLEALGRQRLRYLPLLNQAQLAPLWLLVQANARAGNPLTTIDYVARLRSAATTPAQRALLRDAELGAHLALGHTGETRRLALAWCAEADPAGNTALGWKILAGLAHASGEFEQARWIALQPVVSASHQPMDFLDTCYALAISAADRLKDQPHALVLYRELRDRGLVWPADPAFADLGHRYALLAITAPVETPPAETLPQAPPASAPALDLNQPLEPVRKIVGPVASPAPQR